MVLRYCYSWDILNIVISQYPIWKYPNIHNIPVTKYCKVQNIAGITEIVDVVNLEALDARLYHEPRWQRRRRSDDDLMAMMAMMMITMMMTMTMMITTMMIMIIVSFLATQSDGQFDILPNELDFPAKLR